MNIKWNFNSGGINNTWKNARLVSRQSLVNKLFGVKNSRGTTNIINQSIDGDTYTKGMSITSTKNSSSSKETTKANSSVEAVLADWNKLCEAGESILYSFDEEDGSFQLNSTGSSCDYKQLKAALGYKHPKTMEVSDNTITFENNSYYKFTDSSGKEHKVLSIGGSLECDFEGNYNSAEYDYYDFWNSISRAETGTYSYSAGEVRSRLSDAGIQDGFFNINIGDNKQTKFLSHGKNSLAVYSKDEYDKQYNDILSGSLLKDYEAGTIIKIDGKEYTVDENGKIPSVPYGADIWDIEYPSNYRFGKKIE